MEEGNEGRMDMCFLCAAHSSQLGRVNGHYQDWVKASAVHRVQMAVRRFPWGMEWHLVTMVIINMVTKTESVAFSLGFDDTQRFFKESSFFVIFKAITHTIPESFF